MLFPFSLYGDWALALVRVVLGVVLLVHGWPKLKNLKTTSANFSAMGFIPGSFWGPLVAVAEFFGGLALVLGVWIQFAGPVIAAEFVVISIWKLVRRQPFVGGLEFDLLILAAALLLLTQGAGALSLDKFFSGGF